jgi:2-C-methyl-D-erythritol 2,4-cyclodiphosphate synthase
MLTPRLRTHTRQIGRGYRVSNVDVTLICQKPRVNIEHNGHQVKSLMMKNLARLLRVAVGRVNVKARTHENVDAVSAARVSHDAPAPVRTGW